MKNWWKKLAIGMAIVIACAAGASAVVDKIVFSSNESGNHDIWMINPDGTGKTQLTNSPVNEFSPRIAHDGKTIAFTRFDGGQYRGNIYFYDVVTGSITQITSANDVAYDLSWSPDDSKIAYSRTCGGRQIAVYDLEEGTTNVITGCGGSAYGAIWHPTDGRIYFWSSIGPGCTWGMFSVPSSGGTAQRTDSWTFHDESWAFNPTNPNDVAICMDYTTSCTGHPTMLARYNRSAGTYTIIHNVAGSVDRSPSWSPDGSQIAFISHAQASGSSSNIYVIDPVSGSTTNITNFNGVAIGDLNWGAVEEGEQPQAGSFVHITDLHVESSNDQGWPEKVAYLRDTVKPTFVVATGDVVQWGYGDDGKENYDLLVRPLFGSIGDWYIDVDQTIPIYFSTGNHDAYIKNFKTTLQEDDRRKGFGNYLNTIGSLYDTFRPNGTNISIVSLNSGMDGDNQAESLPEGEGFHSSNIDYLRSVLAQSSGTGRSNIVFMHHPHIGNGRFLHNTEAFLSLCEDYQVEFVLGGHVHSPGGWQYAPNPFGTSDWHYVFTGHESPYKADGARWDISSDANSTAFAVTREFKNERGDFGFYRKIEFDAEGKIISVGGNTRFPDIGAVFTKLSPVDIVITDPSGGTVDRYASNIEDASYESYELSPGDTGATVYVLHPLKGIYHVAVTPWANADPNAHYSLYFAQNDDTVWLAREALVSSVPAVGYLVSTLDTGSVSGLISANGIGREGISVKIADESGSAVASAVTGSDGKYLFVGVNNGNYIVSITPPLGYRPDEETKEVTVKGLPVEVNFTLSDVSTGKVMDIWTWKDQIKAIHDGAYRYNGLTRVQVTKFGQLVFDHFYGRADGYAIQIPGITYMPGPRALTYDDIYNLFFVLPFDDSYKSRAERGMLVNMLNVAGGFQGELTVVTKDGATWSQAMTHLYGLYQSGGNANYLLVYQCMQKLHMKQLIAAGVIPLSTPNILYRATSELVPTEFSLSQNYPNPFNPSTNISFSLPVASDYKLAIFNVNGQLVEEINGHSEAGTVSLMWDGSRMASGVYLYRLTAGDFAETKKMMMLK